MQTNLRNISRLLSLMLGLVWLNPTSVWAQVETATSSSEMVKTEITIEKKVADQNETATQILQNLERLAKNPNQSEEIKDKYDGVTNKTRGFIAQVVSFKDESFKISTPEGEELFITPDKSTTIVKKGEVATGENFVLADWFAVDDWLVLIGVQNGDIFQPRRILISSESLAPVKHFVTRGVVKMSTASKIDVIPLGQEAAETFKIDKASNLVNADNETITYQDLELESQVLLIGTQREDGVKQLETLRLL